MSGVLPFRPVLNPVLAGAAAAAAFTFLWQIDPAGLAGIIRERAIDSISLAFPREALDANVLVADIDDRTLARRGGWPLPRADLSRLTSILAEAGASVIAFDIYFSGADRRSARTLAQEIAAEPGNDKMAQFLASVPDSDAEFARSLTDGRTVLGGLGAQGKTPLTVNFIRTEGNLSEQAAGAIEGVAGPHQPLADAALGLGVLSLFGEENGMVRRVPLILAARQILAPGLALETARIASGANMLTVDGQRGVVKFGSRFVPLAEKGSLRIHWSDPAKWPARTISAIDLLDGAINLQRLAGAAVVVGASAPEAGALRPTPAGPLTPTAQIQAEAVEEILDGNAPYRPRFMPWLENAAMLALSIGAALIAIARGPVFAVAGLACLIFAWIAFAGAALLAAQIAVDPAGPALAALLAGNMAGAASFARTRRLKALISRRFEQYLAPGVVREIIAQPERLKRAGELREITALFTDIEDFTPMANRLAPQELIALLDGYFDNLCKLVTQHGGMVDGIVGDAIHAFFNIPLERDGHAAAALDCGLAIIQFSERFRREPQAAQAGFGRTRVGIETGPAIVGDVGGPQRLNYTAHGDAVIVAARLEAANKLFATSILIGPGCAAALGGRQLVSLGPVQLKGRASKTEAFTVDAAFFSAPTKAPHPHAGEPIPSAGSAERPAR
ncbi:MAG: adenylate/guanylate cyclase domain-containing protein [Beijerinckiaceae bacterium]|nr:adenylate/guanylate cyclase domain-containing protein [Beijerinckiaceae bacterium]